MAQFLLLLTGALVVGAIVFGIAVLLTGGEGLGEVEPDGRAVPLPVARPLVENDMGSVRFDTALRGYRMEQVDHALRRAAYDIGFKSELIQVLEAEVTALRDGRLADADSLRDARRTALGGDSDREPAARDADREPAARDGAAAAGGAVVGSSGDPTADPASDPAAGRSAGAVVADPVDSVNSVDAVDSANSANSVDSADAGTEPAPDRQLAGPR